MMNSENPFSSIPSQNGWKESLRLDVFLSHSADCREICEVVKDYLQDDINTALRDYALTIQPTMYENWPPSLKNGTATESSLAGVEFSSVVFAFIYKKHGEIRNEEIFHSIELYKQKQIQDVHVFFKEIPFWHWLKADEKIADLRQKLRESLTYYSYDKDVEVIKRVSQIIIKAVCELKKLDGTPISGERLRSYNAENGK